MKRFASKRFLATILLFLVCSLAQPQTPTNTTVYIYDELGRLKAVITPSGEAAVYTYDAAGNIVSITRQLSTTVSIIEFTPGQGAAGTSVTIMAPGSASRPHRIPSHSMALLLRSLRLQELNWLPWSLLALLLVQLL